MRIGLTTLHRRRIVWTLGRAPIVKLSSHSDQNIFCEATMVDQSAIEKFKASLRGELLRPGDSGYDDARKIWNGMIDKRPALIARCTGVADVIHCVNFAHANSMLVAV